MVDEQPNSHSAASSSEDDGVIAGEVQPEFQHLESERGGDSPAPTLINGVTPFTADEIVSGAALALTLGLRLEEPDDIKTFQEAFTWVIRPVFPTSQVVEQLRLGQALAHYGVGKGRGLGGGELPPLVRLVAGSMALGLAGYMAHQAVLKGRHDAQAAS